jgi:hypothetical protein
MDSARPVVVFSRARLLSLAPKEPRRVVEVELQNVGAGPALDIRADVWVFPSPVEAEWDKAIAELESRAKVEPPHGSLMFIALGAGERALPKVITPARSIYFDSICGERTAVVIMALSCADIYDRRMMYPSPSGPGKATTVRRHAVLVEDRFVTLD